MFAELDAAAVSESTGAFFQSGDRTFMHATGFVVNPEGMVASAHYSPGPIGRFPAPEVLRAITFIRSR